MSAGGQQADRRIGEDLEWLERLLHRAWDNADLLADNEVRFIDDLFGRLERFGADTFLSPRQRRWLEKIEGRLDKAGAPKDADDPGDAEARPVDEAMS